MPVHDRTSFESLYTGQPRWEIGRPQKALLAVADRITGSILDAGCGTGENALFFAGRGQTVTGFDFLTEPVNLAKQNACERRCGAFGNMVIDRDGKAAVARSAERYQRAIKSR